jgi:hypothetical protein
MKKNSSELPAGQHRHGAGGPASWNAMIIVNEKQVFLVD